MVKQFLWVLMLFLLFAATGLKEVKAQDDTSKIELGAHFTIMNQPFKRTSIQSCTPQCQITEISSWEQGFGGRFGFNVTRYITLEAELNTFSEKDSFAQGFAATIGNTGEIQGLFGVKAGIRRDKLGLFGKARPGFIRFNDVTQCLGEDFTSCGNTPKTEFALDIGGVFEYYPSRNLVIRTDIGDTVIRFSGVRFLPVPDPGLPQRGPFILGRETRHNMQVNVGFGVRF